MSLGRAAVVPSVGPEISVGRTPEVELRQHPHERLSRLMREGFEPVWRLLRRLGVPADAAEDAAQEVFLVAARRIDTIALGSERSYLYGTALRIAQSARRKSARESLRNAPLDEGRVGGPRNPEELLDERQRLALLDELLATLQEDERSAFVLFELEGLTLSEISEVTGVPRGTVASRLRRARSRFVRVLAARKRSSERGRGTK